MSWCIHGLCIMCFTSLLNSVCFYHNEFCSPKYARSEYRTISKSNKPVVLDPERSCNKLSGNVCLVSPCRRLESWVESSRESSSADLSAWQLKAGGSQSVFLFILYLPHPHPFGFVVFSLSLVHFQLYPCKINLLLVTTHVWSPLICPSLSRLWHCMLYMYTCKHYIFYYKLKSIRKVQSKLCLWVSKCKYKSFDLL